MPTMIGTFNNSLDANGAAKALRLEGLENVVVLPASSSLTDQWIVSVRPPFGMGRCVTDIMDQFNPSSFADHADRGLAGDTAQISRLSGRVSPGLISRLSAHKSAGAISRLSGRVAPGAVASLSASKHQTGNSRLPSQWLLSRALGIPLLTRSQAPIEPDSSLLIDDR